MMNEAESVISEKTVKSYADCIEELGAGAVYEGLLCFGLFGDKIPPVLSSKSFFDYISGKKQGSNKKSNGWITYRYTRNSSEYREFGIPNPFVYEALARCIRDNWSEIQNLLENNVKGNPYKISRIHPRKLNGTKAIFEMNYKPWWIDDNPIPALLLGKRYVVKCDISRCFPSIYTHAIDWAIVGKLEAKKNKKNGSKIWSRKLDACAANIKNGETHGLLIGPHSSNLLAEIILTKIDGHLFKKGYKFVRNIDDYECYVKSYENAESFVVDLERALFEYGLSINQSKTVISKLPKVISSSWTRKLKNYCFSGEVLSYKDVQSYLDYAIELMEEIGGNASVLLYALKVLSNSKLSTNAAVYYSEMGMHLACLYPYLAPHIENSLIKPTGMEKAKIKSLSEIMYKNAINGRDYLTVCYSLYFATKYGFDLKVESEEIIQSGDCLLKLFSFLYAKKRNKKELRNALKEHAKKLELEEFDRNWLFAYQALKKEDLPEGEWREIKNNGVSFVDKDALKNK